MSNQRDIIAKGLMEQRRFLIEIIFKEGKDSHDILPKEFELIQKQIDRIDQIVMDLVGLRLSTQITIGESTKLVDKIK